MNEPKGLCWFTSQSWGLPPFDVLTANCPSANETKASIGRRGGIAWEYLLRQVLRLDAVGRTRRLCESAPRSAATAARAAVKGMAAKRIHYRLPPPLHLGQSRGRFHWCGRKRPNKSLCGVRALDDPFDEPMEYPLGADSDYGACKPTQCSGIQKPGLRRPCTIAGSQKRLTRHRWRLFLCAESFRRIGTGLFFCP